MKGIKMEIKKPVVKPLALILTLVLLYNAVGSVSAHDELIPFFSLHLLAPTNNPLRMQYAQLLEAEFAKIGVDVELDLVAWPAIGPRCYYDEAGTYLEGGYDMCCLSYSYGATLFSISPVIQPGYGFSDRFHRNSIPPFGYNIAMWSNISTDYLTDRASEQSELIEKIYQEVSQVEARKMCVEWQKIFYDVSPILIVLNEMDFHAVSTGLYGYDPIGYPIASAEDQWLTGDYTGTAGKIVLGTSDTGTRFFDFLGKSVYDQYIAGPVQDALVGNTPSREMIIPPDVDRATWMNEHYHDVYGTSGYLECYPRIAIAMGTYSADGLQYTIEIRDDVYWHDGHRVDGWDVAFGFQAELQPDARSSQYGVLKSVFGTDDKANKHGNYSFTITDEDNDDFYETIVFNFNQIWTPFVPTNLGTSVKPEHILGDPDTHGFDAAGDFDVSLWQVHPVDWVTHSMNTANPDDEGGYKGPIGCGSLVFYNRDPTSKVVTLKKFDGWMWDNTTKAWVENITNRHFLAKDGRLEHMPETFTIAPKTEVTAFTEIKKGEVNLIDPWLIEKTSLAEIHADPTITAVLTAAFSWQGLFFNPKYVDATGTHHLKKKGVRHGISHAIPREDIIENLLHGLGAPGYTPFAIQSWATINPEDLLQYKKTVVATDGSRPEEMERTHFDSYNLSLALDWFETEGYDVQPYREVLNRPSAPSFIPGFGIVIAFIACVGLAAFLSRKQH